MTFLCYSKDFDEHLLHLQAIFNRPRRAGLTLKLSKCEFCQTKAHYLGRIFTPEGIEADPKKVLAMVNLPRAKNHQGIALIAWIVQFLYDVVQRIFSVGSTSEPTSESR